MINYFGTDTREKGHYFREITEWGIDYKKSIDMKQIPFYPYDYPKKEIGDKYAQRNGTIGFYYEHEYSICAIIGSAIDTRPGCHSVFFFKEKLTQDQLIEKIKSLPAAIDIINKMPFHVEHFKS